MMKYIPVFTCAAGAATLILHEIPVWKKAYILPQSVFTSQSALLTECAAFCRAAGAQAVYARLDGPEECWTFACQLWERVRHGPLPEPTIRLTPVLEENKLDYRTLYHRRFQDVVGAISLDAGTVPPGAWLWLEDGQVLGLGQVQDGELRATAAARPGLGYALALALLEKAGGETQRLQVNSDNLPALRLYERLGFEKSSTLCTWYQLSSGSL